MEKLLNSVQKYVMLVVVVLSGTVYGAAPMEQLPPLSERAEGFLHAPIIESFRIINPNDPSRYRDATFSDPECRKMLISFCDNMTEDQVNAVFDSAVSEMKALYARITAGGDSARRACDDVICRRPAAGQQGRLFFDFLGRGEGGIDLVGLGRLGQIAGLTRSKKDSPFSINTTEDKKLFIALCVAVLNRVLDDWNWHNQCMRENRGADGMYHDDLRAYTEQEYDDLFYNDSLVETFSEPESSAGAWNGLTSAVREVIENIH